MKAKRTPKVAEFSVDLTVYGWRVSKGEDRLGLFASQNQALDDVRKRSKPLESEGIQCTVKVTGQEAPRSRMVPFMRH
jgi:hypothetical protein